MNKFLNTRRIVGVLASATLVCALAVVPGVSSAASRAAHLSTSTCVATGTATPSLSGAVSLALGKASATGGCNATVRGHWAANSSDFATSYASDATVSSSGAWSAPIASPQLSGTVSGTVVPKTGAAGASSSLFWSIDCVITYSPLRIRCTIYIGGNL